MVASVQQEQETSTSTRSQLLQALLARTLSQVWTWVPVKYAPKWRGSSPRIWDKPLVILYTYSMQYIYIHSILNIHIIYLQYSIETTCPYIKSP